jgi:hypothetical protein
LSRKIKGVKESRHILISSRDSFFAVGPDCEERDRQFTCTLSSFEEITMYNPYDVESRWELSKMDDAHYYSMGTWAGKPKKSLLGRIFSIAIQLVSWLWLRPFIDN